MMTDKEIFDAIRARKGSPLTQDEVDSVNRILHAAGALAPETPLAWGGSVTPTFRTRVRQIAARLGIDPNDLMACMAWESGRTFAPNKKNLAGSGATGLIQFMPTTAESLGTSTAALAQMSAEEQLTYVEKYFQPYKGKLRDLSDIYMAILWPKAVGKSPDYVLWDKRERPVTYRQNAGLDSDRNGIITKAECSAKLYNIKAEGLRPENLG